MLHRISAGTIVEHEGRVLLVHHQRAGKYDFWVAPGGGVMGQESLEQAARRETKEETGLDVAVSKLIYIEEFFNPECRYVKFWFAASLIGGAMDFSHPDTVAEFIVDAGWMSHSELRDKTVFPPVLVDRYWDDREAGFQGPTSVPLRQMQFW
jgi:8-oxo-dGTP diphosphatase